MKQIGGYEIIGELSRSGRGMVYRARRVGENDPHGKYTIRTREDPFGVIPADEWHTIAQEFLEQVADQKKTAESAGGAGHWAKVYEEGRFDNTEDGSGEGGNIGAYCVTEFYETSAERLGATQQDLDADAVANIVRQIVQGVQELEKACGRPHGQLKPARVLLRDRQDLASTRVVLIDPLPPSRVDAAQDRERDARSIAELIHLLITHRAVNERVWPVPEAPEWITLGNKGKRWLSLTNTLLDPRTGAERPTPEQMLAEIDAIETVKGGVGGKKIPIIAGAATFVLIVGGVGAYLALSSSKNTNGNGENGEVIQQDIGSGGDLNLAAWGAEQQAQWAALCAAYRQWLDPLIAESRKPAVQQTWQNAGLGELAGLLSQVNEGDPRRIAEAAGVSPELVRLERATPDDVKRTKYIERIGAAAAALNRVNAIFTTEAGGWSTLIELKSRAAEYRERGWTAAGDAVDRAVASVEPGSARAAALITQTIAVKGSVDKVQALWMRLDAAQQRMNELSVVGSIDGSTPDPILAKYSRWSAAAGAAGKVGGAGADSGDALASVSAGLERALTTADELVTFLETQWRGLDHELLRGSGEYAELLTAEPNAETFNRFKVVAAAYPSLDPATDPRRGWTPDETLTRVSQTIDEMAKEPLSIDVPADMRASLTTLQAEAAALAKLAWNKRYEQQVRDRFARASESIRQLDTRAQGMLAAGRARLATSYEEVKRELQGTQQIAASASLNIAWQAGRDAMIAQYPAEKFGELRSAADALQEAIKAGEAAMPKLEPPSGSAAGDVSRIITEEAADLREQRIREAMTAGGVTGGGAKPTPEAVSAAMQSAAAMHEQDITRLGALSSDAAAAAALLAGAYGLNETASVAGGGVESLAAYAEKWKADPTAAKLAAINDRIAALQVISQQNDATALTQRVRQASAQTPETALAAWRKLGDVQPVAWPGTVQQLETERDFAGLLRGAIGGVENAERQRALLDEFASVRRQRWASFADRASTSGDVESALAMMSDFGVGEAELSPRQAYNLAVQRLRTAARAAGADDAAARAAAEQFRQSVSALPAEAAAQGGGTPARTSESIAALLAEQPPPEPVFVPADNGPGKSGWAGVLDAGGEIVRYTRANNSLVFRRVEAPSGAMFVQVNELTLGEFQAIVEASAGGGGWDAMGEIIMESYRPGDDDFRDGPCVWRWDRGGASGGRLVKSASWLAHVDDPTLDVPLYAPGIAVDNNAQRGGRLVSTAAGGETTESHPIQRVSALAAAYVAQLAGCRLPSPDEWLAAKALATESAAANVRDQTWSTQRQYAEQIMQTGRDRFPVPSAGAFDPGGASDASAVNDAVLWFRASTGSTDGTIREMSGNVAEYAVGNAAALDAAAGVDALRGALSAGAAGDGVHVMGRSALSPPNVAEERDAPIATLDSTADGYADVGFRLVFSAAGTIAAPPPLAQRVLQALGENAYVLGAP